MADATIILAGGSGTRLWPASIAARPKQLARIGGRESLIALAVRRALAVTDGPVVIVTHRDHVAPIAEDLAPLGLPQGRIHYLPEPVARNTAPAVALGVHYLHRLFADGAPGTDGPTVVVLTADHVISPVERFAADAEAACRLAREGRLVCFGVPPTRPETGYGYLEAGAPLAGGFAVRSFREKPDAATAAEYLGSGSYYWNAGMFCFTTGAFLAALAEHVPAIAGAFEAASSLDPDALAPVYEALPKISIDYAVMEKSRDVAVVPASFGWTDVGSWDEAAALVEASSQAAPAAAAGLEAAAAPVVRVESDGCFVDSELPVVLCGVSGLHVVVRNGRVLVCRRGASQLVKEAVDAAAAAGYREML